MTLNEEPSLLNNSVSAGDICQFVQIGSRSALLLSNSVSLFSEGFRVLESAVARPQFHESWHVRLRGSNLC